MTNDSQSDNPPLIKRGMGVSMVWRKGLGDRMPRTNLKPFLTTLGWIANYEFDESDWDEAVASIEKTNFDDDLWFDYEIVGSHSLRVRMSQVDDELIAVDLNVPAELLPLTRLALEICSFFALSSNPVCT
jgi:hypothetical protein